MTPDEAIAKLKTLPEAQQREVLFRLSPDERQGILGKLKGASFSAAPPRGSISDIKSRLMTARDWAIQQLPALGGVAGGVVGSLSGAETGPGAIVTGTAGAAAGGGLGEDLRQTLTEHFHPEDQRMTAGESALRMALASGSQGLQELGGQVVGRLTGKALNAVGSHVIPEQVFQKYPILKTVFAKGEGVSPKAAQHLTAAASGKPGAGITLEAVTNTLGDLEQEITKLPPRERTVEGFLKSVNTRKDGMNLESGIAMRPIAGQKIIPTGIADNIRNLANRYDPDIPGDRQVIAYIKKKASEWEHEISYGALDSKRTRLSNDLSSHAAQLPVPRYAAKMGDIDLAIDNAILDGLRDTVYPAMDKAAGKPVGYFENLKGRQSSLIALQKILDKRVRDLKGAQAVSEATSPFGKENVSVYARAGGLPRAYLHGAKEAVVPTREMEEASKHVGKAFSSVDSLPYQMLFAGELRAAQMKGPKTKELEQIREQQLQPTP